MAQLRGGIENESLRYASYSFSAVPKPYVCLFCCEGHQKQDPSSGECPQGVGCTRIFSPCHASDHRLSCFQCMRNCVRVYRFVVQAEQRNVYMVMVNAAFTSLCIQLCTRGYERLGEVDSRSSHVISRVYGQQVLCKRPS